MARGGYRPGAGRPKGSKNKKNTAKGKKKTKKSPIPEDIKQEAKAKGMNPIDYMLQVMRDPSADEERRDRMAIAAAPYVHPKASGSMGKKEDLAERAKKVGAGKFSSGPAPLKAVK